MKEISAFIPGAISLRFRETAKEQGITGERTTYLTQDSLLSDQYHSTFPFHLHADTSIFYFDDLTGQLTFHLFSGD